MSNRKRWTNTAQFWPLARWRRRRGSRCIGCWSLNGPRGLPAGAIAERLGVAPSSLSFHLQQLLHAGLVTQRRAGRQLIYAAEYETMNALLAYLTENCCGRGQSCAPFCTPAELAMTEKANG